MKLSAPLHVLKSKAKSLKKSSGIPLHQALDQIAKQEGYTSWSLLVSKQESFIPTSKAEILDYLNPGDLMIIAAKQGQGKTLLATDLLNISMRQGNPGYFFSLEYSLGETEILLHDTSLLTTDVSDDISADYIIEKTKDVDLSYSLIVIDFLQLLDQRRDKPEIRIQIDALKKFAKEKQCMVILISQVDRNTDQLNMNNALKHIRMPNKFELNKINKVAFLSAGKCNFVKPDKFSIDTFKELLEEQENMSMTIFGYDRDRSPDASPFKFSEEGLTCLICEIKEQDIPILQHIHPKHSFKAGEWYVTSEQDEKEIIHGFFKDEHTAMDYCRENLGAVNFRTSPQIGEIF